MKTLTLLTFLLAGFLSLGQRSAIYVFDQDFHEKSDALPALKWLGGKGTFVKDRLPELGNVERYVYQFGKNQGLQFENAKAEYFFGRSYSIEMYFRFDKLDSWKRVIDFKNRTKDDGCYIYNGRLNFYNIAKSDIAPVSPHEYTHYIITRDEKTKMVKIYADGIAKLEFKDVNEQAVISGHQVMNFFYDDLQVQNEASAGAVAMIKMYDYTINPEEAMQAYTVLETTIEEATSEQTSHIQQTTNALTIKVMDSESKEPIFAQVKITKAGNTLLDERGGEPMILNQQTPGDFDIKVEAEGFEVFHKTESISAFPFEKVIMLQAIKEGQTIQLSSIQFVISKPVMLPGSYQDLDHLVELLEANPKMEILIGGHTDNRGSASLNQKLSEDRAKVVKEYLIEKGIDKKRLQSEGFGGSKPLNSNRTEAERKINRRVEFTIVRLN